jgi:nucleotide-binding universal stress UspA family protein
MFQHILVALDGSELAERVLPQVEALAERFQSRIVLLRATTSAAEVASLAAGAGLDAAAALDPTPMIESERTEATSYLDSVARRLATAGAQVSVECPEGPAARAIVDEARRREADLIAMTTHGRSGLAHLVFGSVAEEVLHRAPCPVLLVRVHERD